MSDLKGKSERVTGGARGIDDAADRAFFRLSFRSKSLISRTGWVELWLGNGAIQVFCGHRMGHQRWPRG